MGGQRFEDLVVWQKARSISVAIYKAFKDCKDFGFKDQVTRSSLSIPSNIAEGYERGSNKEFVRFLLIAKGSCGELRTQILVAAEVDLLASNKASALVEQATEISYMLSSLIKMRRSFSS